MEVCGYWKSSFNTGIEETFEENMLYFMIMILILNFMVLNVKKMN